MVRNMVSLRDSLLYRCMVQKGTVYQDDEAHRSIVASMLRAHWVSTHMKAEAVGSCERIRGAEGRDVGFSSDTLSSYLLIIDIPYANPVAGALAPCSLIVFLDNELVIRILGQKKRQSLGHALEVRKQTISWELDSYERMLESVRYFFKAVRHQGDISPAVAVGTRVSSCTRL